MKPNIHISKNDSARIKDAHAVRNSVFHIEQGISNDLDFDEHDSSAIQFVAYHDDNPVGTARIRFPYSPDQGKLERLAVLSEMRGQKIGQQILEAIEQHLIEIGIAEIIMNSQLSAKGFYEKLGYEPEGDEYEEVGIPHVKMKKKLNQSTLSSFL